MSGDDAAWTSVLEAALELRLSEFGVTGLGELELGVLRRVVDGRPRRVARGTSAPGYGGSQPADAEPTAAESEPDTAEPDAGSGAGARPPLESSASAISALPDSALMALAGPVLSGEQGLTAEQCLDGVEAAHVLGARLEAARMHAAAELSRITGDELLGRRGVVGPDELSRTAREVWRREVKRVVAVEIGTLTGMGRGKARQLVAIALAPRAVVVPVREALRAGVARWTHADQFWERCRTMPPEHAAEIADSLFAATPDPERVAAERLDPEGRLTTDPWQAKDYAEALHREATRHEARDPEAEARKRAARWSKRTTYVQADDDGIAQLVITGDIASVVGCQDRLNIIAKKARQKGDQRSEAQIRSDVARALLHDGVLLLQGEEVTTPPGEGPPASPAAGDRQDEPPPFAPPDLMKPEDRARVQRILAGLPPVELQVIVPWDVLAGRAVGQAGAAHREHPSGVEGLEGLEGVGRVLGSHPVFLDATSLRELGLRPGTTLTRLLVDPADGRCVEQTSERYTPDADMRRQLYAADVTSRAPGSTTPARDGQLDHVEEFPVGPTGELNLQALEIFWHHLKTAKLWDAIMDVSRNVTWESFFGRLHRTRPHDYRQYLGTSTAGAAEGAQPAQLSSDDRRELASLATYAALASREGERCLEADDDDPWTDDGFPLDLPHLVSLRRTRDSDGRKVEGVRPGTPTPEEVLAEDPRVVLDTDWWTDPGNRRRPAEEQADDDAAPF